MSPHDPVTAESIDRLCALGDLPVPAERRLALAAMLSGLVVAANELNRKMATAGHRTVAPILRFPQRAAQLAHRPRLRLDAVGVQHVAHARGA